MCRAAGKECLDEAIKDMGPGVPIRHAADAIARVIDRHRSAGRNYSIVAEFLGHGIGTVFHTLPLVQHTRNFNSSLLVPGMTFTIEPIIVDGEPQVRRLQSNTVACLPASVRCTRRQRCCCCCCLQIDVWPDGWTAVTLACGRSAQFEHTMLVTSTGVDILTDYPEDDSFPDPSLVCSNRKPS